MEGRLDTTVGKIKGVGPKSEALLNKLGIYSIQNLIDYYPRGYDLYENPVQVENLEESHIMAVRGQITGNVSTVSGRRMSVTSVILKDDTGILKLIWFRAPYIKNMLRNGQRIIVRGKVLYKNNQPYMEHPEIFMEESIYNNKIGTLQPIYAVTKGISCNFITKAVLIALNDYAEEVKDIFDEKIRNRYQICDSITALRGIHFPENQEQFIESRTRLVFEEFVTFIVGLRAMKEEQVEEVNEFCMENRSQIDQFIHTLPYELTSAQKKVWEEIYKDVKNPSKNMSRLIQGDVGSGKTIVALFALMLAAHHGFQGAMMAPTEVLAKQHYRTISALFAQYHIPFRVELLTGSMTAKEKRQAYERIENGTVQVIVGTHALIQAKVKYKNLAVVITDEQHRFGVKQREALASKGAKPHVLVMSATPIPRTLAIILYGDLDISVIDELPANRLPIKNCVVGTDYQPTAYQFMKKQIEEGRQCYVICPMVEESERLDGENVIDYSKHLQEIMGENIVVEYLHGKMKQVQKDAVMERYYQKQIHILVSTTVIEVGINVPNASVMLIENAERFGLSGLHQLRGRVGRGEHQSYCIFMTATKSKETKERLAILGKSNDGFYVANEDLKLRGPGDLFGIRQSGVMNFKLADVIQDAKVLQKASEAAQELSQEEVGRILAKGNGNAGVVL
ncbi:MAG: ATP-dependent DNA helicase RecG [Eubacteriales bacterium]